MRTRALSLISLILLLLTLSGLAYAAEQNMSDDTPPLRVGVGSDRPPFSMRNPSGSLVGFDVDIARALCHELKRPCLLAPWPLTRMLEALEAGELDMLVAGLAETPERAKTMLFSDAYAKMPSIFITHKNSLSGDRRKDWNMLAQTGSIQQEYLHARAAHFATVWTLVTVQDILDSLLRGEADAALIDGLPGFAFLLSPQGANFELAGHPLSSAELPDTSHISFALTGEALRKQINTALESIRRNGSYASINRSYFPFDLD